VPTSSSSAQQARQILADRLRELRLDAGLSARELASRAGWERTKVSKIEHATRPPSADAIRVWCRVCGAEDQASDLIASLRAAEGMWVEWRRMERTGLRLAQQGVLPVYERTRQFRAYSSWMVPGLIQAEGYTRAVLRAYQQRRGVADDVEEAVAVRMARQRLLRRGGRIASFVIEEPVLRTGFGGPEVMAGQLAHLAEVTRWPAVSLGVIPAGIADRGLAGPAEDFWIFDSDLVTSELISGYLSVTQPREIAMYAQMFARFTEIAIYGSHARAVIASIANAHSRLADAE
jgi:hypothetical protein